MTGCRPGEVIGLQWKHLSMEMLLPWGSDRYNYLCKNMYLDLTFLSLIRKGMLT
ncbi:hypothetical protein [Tolypothrix sp. PCC 7601]|uniref:hypothetical protein n=1 Tax=Tolypothrix sp. PCC 7601 TaxID=1188 RepID=UPI000AA39930|nr:hypothetical protein [Tolypothrix sp. PCC 7601]MBE9085186.1 hypothetical protein [Tolypothrix sp. LEGE 11397]